MDTRTAEIRKEVHIVPDYEYFEAKKETAWLCYPSLMNNYRRKWVIIFLCAGLSLFPILQISAGEKEELN